MLRDLLMQLAAAVASGTVLGVFAGGAATEAHVLLRNGAFVRAPRLIERFGVYGGLFGLWVPVMDIVLSELVLG